MLTQLLTMTTTQKFPPQSVESAQQLVPNIARLVSMFNQAARTSVLERYHQIEAGNKKKGDSGAVSSATLLHCLCLVGSRCKATDSLALPINGHLPPVLRTALDEWSAAAISAFPPPCGWKNQFEKDPIPGESYIVATLLSHTQGRKFMSCSHCQEFGQLADLALDWLFTLVSPIRSQLALLTQLLTMTTTH